MPPAHLILHLLPQTSPPSLQVAAGLGLGSVRKLLLAGRVNVRDLACPSPSLLSQQLKHAGGKDTLLSDLADLADTLGARGVHFLFDFRVHESRSILQPNLDSLHGPALLVHIEGVEMGPEQLCKLQQKLGHTQQGLRRATRTSPGLSTIYSVTDVPCIISGEGLFFFDPKGTTFIDAAANSKPMPVGKAHLFVNSELPVRFPDQFTPFQVFGFHPSKRFVGSILRLPVRGWSATKDGNGDVVGGGRQGLEVDGGGGGGGEGGFHEGGCRSVGDLEEMLVRAGEGLGGETLVFKECLDKVTVSSWKQGEADMVINFKSFLQPPVSVNLRQARQVMSVSKEWQKFNLMSVFGQCPPIKQSMQVEIVTYDASRNSTVHDKWMVCQSMGTRQARKLALELKDRGVIPLVSAAILIKRGDELMPAIDGGMFAYTPLEPSGLPVHISACFEIEGRQMAWPRPKDVRSRRGRRGGGGGNDREEEEEEEDDEDEEEDEMPLSMELSQKMAWNRELSACVVEVYLDALKLLPEVTKRDMAKMYQAWPSTATCPHWSFSASIIRPLYVELAKQQIFMVGNGSLTKMSGGVFKPSEASDSLRLLFKGMFPIFACPSSLLEEFKKSGLQDVSEITPERVRKRLRKEPRLLDACVHTFTSDPSQRNTDLVAFISDALQYCLVDLSARGHASYKELHGLRLLPMASGQLLCFPFEALVATEGEQRLVPALMQSFVDPICSQRLSQWFTAPDFLQALSLRRFTPAVLAANLATTLPKHWKNQQIVRAYSSSESSSGLPHPSWFTDLWEFVGVDNAHLFNAWPIVPLTNGSLASAAAPSGLLNLPTTLPPHLGAMPKDEDDMGGVEPFDIFPFGTRQQQRGGGRSLASADAGQDADADAGEGAAQCDGEEAISEREEFLRRHPVATALQRLGCPIVHPRFSSYLPACGDADDVFSAAFGVLSSVASTTRLAGVCLHPRESRAMFVFCAREFERSGVMLPQHAATLRMMPIFETRSGSFIALTASEYYICPPGISSPPVGGTTSNNTLLKHQHPAFYASLGVVELDETSFLERFTLPSFSTLHASQRAEAIEHVRKNWTVVKDRPALVSSLKALPFIDMHGILLRPDQLFDPRKPLLSKVFADDPVFPTGQFATDEWLAILRVLGLQSHISADVFLQCARRVQRLFAVAAAQGCPDSKSRAVAVATDLATHLIDSFSSINTPDFCSEASLIAFAPVDMPDGTEAVMRFSDACIPSDRVRCQNIMDIFIYLHMF